MTDQSLIAKRERDHIIGTIRRTCSDDLADRLAAALAREQEAEPKAAFKLIARLEEAYANWGGWSGTPSTLVELRHVVSGLAQIIVLRDATIADAAREQEAQPAAQEGNTIEAVYRALDLPELSGDCVKRINQLIAKAQPAAQEPKA